MGRSCSLVRAVWACTASGILKAPPQTETKLVAEDKTFSVPTTHQRLARKLIRVGVRNGCRPSNASMRLREIYPKGPRTQIIGFSGPNITTLALNLRDMVLSTWILRGRDFHGSRNLDFLAAGYQTTKLFELESIKGGVIGVCMGNYHMGYSGRY